MVGSICQAVDAKPAAPVRWSLQSPSQAGESWGGPISISRGAVTDKQNAKIAELKSLQRRADSLRSELRISRPGEVTFLAARQGMGDDVVVVEADGLGGATTSVVVGNYPVDYLTRFKKSFPSECEAEAAAEGIAFNGESPADILQEPT